MAGQFESVSAAIVNALDALHDEWMPSDAWVRQEVLPVAEACERDPSRMMSSEEVFAAIEERHRRDTEARGRAA